MFQCDETLSHARTTLPFRFLLLLCYVALIARPPIPYLPIWRRDGSLIRCARILRVKVQPVDRAVAVAEARVHATQEGPSWAARVRRALFEELAAVQHAGQRDVSTQRRRQPPPLRVVHPPTPILGGSSCQHLDAIPVFGGKKSCL